MDRWLLTEWQSLLEMDCTIDPNAASKEEHNQRNEEPGIEMVDRIVGKITV
jgi:hypothetical protein